MSMESCEPVLSGRSKGRPKIGFQYRLSLNAGQMYCRMLQHSAILSTFIKLTFVFKNFVLSIFEWPLNTGFTVNVFFREALMNVGIHLDLRCRRQHGKSLFSET